MDFVEIVDQAVNMLGPDLETLTDIFVQLGDEHHEEYGIKPTVYPILESALLEQLEEMLGPEVFTRHTKA
jgi:hemoglobin-like flavoprotein